MKCEGRSREPGGFEPLSESLWCCLEETVPEADEESVRGWERVRKCGLVAWCLGRALDIAMGRKSFTFGVNCQAAPRGKINSLVSLLSASPLKHHHILST